MHRLPKRCHRIRHLDAKGGYWQIKIKVANRKKIDFTSQHGLYWFIWMLFGLRNVPGTFQTSMDVMLSAVEGQFARTYLGDIVLPSKSLEKHRKRVCSVLTLLSDADATLKFKKCHFFAKTFDYIGHVVGTRRLKVASHTIVAIRKLQPPTSFTDLGSFLELCNVFWRFISKFAKIAAHLSKQLWKH